MPLKYGYLSTKLMEAEKDRQHQEAFEEMEREFYFRKRQKDLEEAKKVYQLK